MTKIFFIAMVALVSLLAPNAMAQNFMKSFALCKKITVAEERLACFDALDAPQRPARNSTRPMPETMDKGIEDVMAERRGVKPEERRRPEVPVPSTPKSSEVENEFGLEVKSEVEKLEKVTGTVAKISKSAQRKRNIHLESGAVWQQVDSGYMKIKPGVEVYIERGVLGAYYLGVEGLNRRVKVKRIK